MTTRPAPRRARRAIPPDDRGSMSMLLLVMLVGLMFGSLLVPMILTSSRASTFDKTRVQALDAAQDGIDATLGVIRASTTSGIGDSAKLPCGPGSGTVNSASIAAYAVAVEYFTADPKGEPYPSSRAMRCVAGYGTFDSATGATTPSYARITSTGTVGTPANGSSPSRTLVTTYVFRTSNVNILGGQIPLEGGTLCIDAGAAVPAAGAVAALRACSVTTPAAPQQVFAYRTDLTLQLVSSITAATPNGLCLAPASTPAASGDAVVLAACGPLGSPAYTQQWSYNDNAQYQASQSNSATTGALPNLCMNVASAAAGQNLSVGGCGTVWRPTAPVGPGAAALPQWVNFAEFGRCLDVTYQDVNYPFLISYPCKQNPYPAAKLWNQLFTTPSVAGVASASGQIYTTPVAGGTKYCLTSPGTLNGYVVVRPCVDGNTLQNWTINSGDASLSYSTKYTIVNGSTCLGLGPVDSRASFSSTIIVETCTGATDQKWNAVANVLNPAVKDTYEK